MGDILTAYLDSLPSEERKEAVNSPAHYGGKGTYEAINVIEAYGMGFCDGNVLKYLRRYKKKTALRNYGRHNGI